MMFRTLILGIVALPVLGLGQASRDSRDTARSYVLDPVVITGTNIEVLRSTVPNAVSIVSREDIRRSGETSVLAVLNKVVPGLFLTERGVLGYGVSTGAAGGISIRGAGGSPNTEVLVLTDGRPQMMGLMGHPLPDTYVTAGVERVEVIRGPASLLHGTNAMGGVINIISSRIPAGGWNGDVSASGGTFGTYKLEGGVALGGGQGGMAIRGSRYETNGHRPYSSFKINSGSVRGNYAFSPEYLLTADASVSGFRTFDPGPVTTPRIDNWVDIMRGSSGFSLENRYAGFQGALKAFYNFGVHDIFDGFHSTDNNIGVMFYQGITVTGGTIVTLGLDFKDYGGEAYNTKTRLTYGTHRQSESGLYALVQQEVLSTVTANAGLRLNSSNVYGSALAPQFGITWRTDEATTLRASAARGFRSPTIRELYLFPAPNPGLDPEQMWNYEVGLLRAFGDRVSLECTAFQAEGRNIIRTEGFFPNLKLRNSGSFVHRGIEISGNVRLSSLVSSELTYGFLYPGEQTMANPRHKLYTGLYYTSGMFAVNAGAQYIAGLYGADKSQKALPDYLLVQGRITVTPSPGVSVYFSGENLFNTDYMTMTDYPMPGRTVMGGVRWEMQ
jgi:outer membrane receptor protein involved in Fe transport